MNPSHLVKAIVTSTKKVFLPLGLTVRISAVDGAEWENIQGSGNPSLTIINKDLSYRIQISRALEEFRVETTGIFVNEKT